MCAIIHNDTMKCLSLKQPFADLLAHGEKTIELRKWNTSFRGDFLIHASKNIDIESCERLDIDTNKLTIGAIIGSVFLYDVKEYNILNKNLKGINTNTFL